MKDCQSSVDSWKDSSEKKLLSVSEEQKNLKKELLTLSQQQQKLTAAVESNNKNNSNKDTSNNVSAFAPVQVRYLFCCVVFVFSSPFVLSLFFLGILPPYLSWQLLTVFAFSLSSVLSSSFRTKNLNNKCKLFNNPSIREFSRSSQIWRHTPLS
jgi:hypothetical protein